MKLDLHYVEPRLVELYDNANPRGPDTDFYIQLAAEQNAKVIVDLGCGTGLLTRELAVDGRMVVGIDPSREMLKYAQHQPNANRVAWICGTAEALGKLEADLVIMTGNVAQVFLDESEWIATLRAIHTALRPGGCLAFESRNPEDRAWERWNREATYQRSDSAYGELEEWLELISVRDGQVSFEGHNVFTQTSEHLIIKSELRFRTEAELNKSLISSGFTVDHVYGDWNRGSVSRTSRVMVFVARRD